MTNRERFIQTVLCKEVDRLPFFFYFGPWEETIERWKTEGLDATREWKDMSGKQGSLISPAMVREFMLPNYRKIKDFADRHRIPVISLDTDGDCSELVPLFMESGINLVFPFEVAAGCDIVEYRRKYPNLGIMGGIDKRQIAMGHEAIDRELERIGEMFRHPGYIAAPDYLIHPEISWEDFKYFVYSLKKRIGV